MVCIGRGNPCSSAFVVWSNWLSPQTYSRLCHAEYSHKPILCGKFKLVSTYGWDVNSVACEISVLLWLGVAVGLAALFSIDSARGNRPEGGGLQAPWGGSTGRASQPAERARSAGQGGTPPAPWGSSRRVAPFIPPFRPAGEMGGWFFCVKDLKS